MTERFNFQTVFPCGRGFFPGTQGQGTGGSEPTLTPVIIVPKPIDPPSGPYIPIIPPEEPKWKCVEMSEGPPNIPKAGFTLVNPPYRECRPCDGALTGKDYGPATNPKPNDSGCVHPDKVTCDATCLNPQERIPSVQIPVTTVGGGGSAGQGSVSIPSASGPITGGTQYYKCNPISTTVCPGDENLPLSEARILSFQFQCAPCSQNVVNANGIVVPDPNCIYSSIEACQQNCASSVATQPSSTLCDPPGPQTGGPVLRPVFSRDPLPQVPSQQVDPPQSPSLSVNLTNQSNQITTNQQNSNATTISVNEIVEEEDFRNTQQGFAQPTLFDPEYNFFKTESNNMLDMVPNNFNTNVFNREVTVEVSKLLSNANSNIPWDEVTLQNLSDDQLLQSLNPRLVNTFQYLRHPGGQPIGVSNLVNTVRRHILEGTIDEFDPSFYLQAAEGQINSNFEVLERPALQEHADRLAVNYLINNLYTFESAKPSEWRSFQVNRMRPLNEDINMEVNVTTLDGSRNDLSVPNEGIQVDKITALDQITVPSVGAPDKLNIGDGGGYYIDSTNLQAEEIPVPTDNIIPHSYYAPASVRMKVLEMLDVDPAITITASSLANQHEFVSGDSGASAVKPLFFAINLSSVEGDYFSDSLVENYSATYSLLTASSDIQVHLNNNALNVPMLAVDYRDPLYRYILDTSSFTASLNDFNLNGFKDKGFSSIGSRFVRNIPFGFVVTPVAGGKYNPFNGRSTLEKHGDIHVRSIATIPATDATIDGNPGPMFRSYSLNLEDGVNRVGIAEQESTQNIGYRYNEEDFTQTFYSASAGEYGFSSIPTSAQGTAYMLREVVDYLSSTYNTTTLTWYDVFSRMPITRMGEMFYDSNTDLILEIANGLRGGIRIENIESGWDATTRIIPEDSKTIVKSSDRNNVTKVKI